MTTEMLTTRTWNAVVIFQRPFILDGFGEIQPAGTYSIDTEEEKVTGSPGALEAWRRIDTRIGLRRYGSTEYISVHPNALIAALERDQAQADNSSIENTAKSRLFVARKLNSFSSRRGK